MPARLQLLGSPTIELDGAALALPFERRTQLLVLLALRGGWIGRAEVAALLWPEAVSTLALTHLRKTLFRLRGLPWADCVQVQGGALRVEAQTDLHLFEQALREQRASDALAQHAGELLAGFDDDANPAWTDWLQFERARVRSAWRAAALARLETDAATVPGDGGAQALQLSARLLEADPLDEAALRVHITLLARAGQAARASQAYREFAARLGDELGIAPGPELKALHDGLVQATAVDGGLRPAPAAAAPAAGAPDDAGFIGRAVERRHIQQLLADGAVRLLCVIGPGGIGKTRLAQRAWHDLRPAFADGAHFVALEDVDSADELAQRIARSAGVTVQGGDPVWQQLGQALGTGQRLLVLDNFEQLAGASAALQALLADCPRLKLLVTSRIRLGLAAEHLLPLEGLPCPDPEDIDRYAAFDAAQLFVGAAQRVDPSFAAAGQAAAIVDICRQVDGLPLALELAAAWTRLLPCAAIAAELRAGTALLQAQGAGHPPRHASIEQVFEQSWRHLVSAERQTLARLAVFQGGFTLDAARAVTACALPVLGSLADKSLLRKEGARLSLHPLVQQYAALRLTGSERATTRAAHAAYFQRLLPTLNPGAQLGAALRAVENELHNFLLAWDWSICQGQAEATQRCASVLGSYFEHRGRFETWLQWLNRALEARPLQDRAALLTWLRGESAQALYRLDRYPEAEAVAREALQGAGRGADTGIRLRALNVVAVCALRQGRLAEARRLFQQVYALATTQREGRLAATTLDHLGLVEKRLGNYGEALRLIREALAQHRAEGDETRIALCLNNLATLHQTREDPAAALPHLREALAICERDGLNATLAFVLANLVEVTMALGAEAEAEQHAARALEVTAANASRAVNIWVQAQQGRLQVRRGDLSAAASTLASALSRARESALVHGYAPALLGFAELLRAHGDTPAGQHVLRMAADHPSIHTNERDELLTYLARWGSSDGAAASGAPAIGFDELVQSLVAEAHSGHARLRARLRGGAAAAPSDG